MKKFNVDNAIQEIANHFKSEILKGNFKVSRSNHFYQVKVSGYDLTIATHFDKWTMVTSILHDAITFTDEENTILSDVIKNKEAELKELEKVNLAKEIAAKQRLLDSM